MIISLLIIQHIIFEYFSKIINSKFTFDCDINSLLSHTILCAQQFLTLLLACFKSLIMKHRCVHAGKIQMRKMKENISDHHRAAVSCGIEDFCETFERTVKPVVVSPFMLSSRVLTAVV